MRLALIGRTRWLLNSAEHLLADGHTLALVATATAEAEYAARENDFQRLADRCGAPFHLNPDVNHASFVEALSSSGAALAISVNWPSLIRSAACEALTNGILNCHAGDLPRYRGNACPNWAILNGETVIGACCHRMDPNQVDAGPIFARRRLPIDDEISITDVYEWLDQVIPELFSEAVQRVMTPGFEPEDQARSGIRPLRCHRRRPEDGLIDWKQPADQIARLVRASAHPFAGAYSYVEGNDRVTIWKAHAFWPDHDICAVPGQIVGRGPSGGIAAACGSGFIEIERFEGQLTASNARRLTGPK